MSLIELLVVIAILGLLAVTVLPTLASTTETRRTREAARVASSFIASAQTRALGRREWSGFRVLPVAMGSNVALDLTLVDVPPSYRGDTTAAKLTVPVLSGTTSTGTATGTAGDLNSMTILGIGANDRIRFADRDPWYEIAAVFPNASTPAVVFRRQSAAGYEATNTPWPPAAHVPFEIALRPVAYGTSITLGEGRVVDIRWSGYDNLGSYVPFLGGGVTVLFDGTGRVRSVEYRDPPNMKRAISPGAIYLLVGRADRAGKDPLLPLASPQDDSVGANWQYTDSFWVMINPATGTVHQASCNPTATTEIASQSFVRAYLSAGGGS